jgi:hypothetical protein
MKQFEKSFDMRSARGDGYELSKEIICKIDALLMLASTPPVTLQHLKYHHLILKDW